MKKYEFGKSEVEYLGHVVDFGKGKNAVYKGFTCTYKCQEIETIPGLFQLLKQVY